MLATCSSSFRLSPLRLRPSDSGRLSNLTASSRAAAFPSSYGSYSCIIRIRKERQTAPVKVINEPAVTETNLTASLASEVVRSFYEGINRRDLSSVEELIASDCVYEDLIFAQPFVGRKAILEFFESFMDSISSDLVFVIDDISEQDASAVGVTWHLEWKGRSFPFSKGCSFYRLNQIKANLQIIYGRDCVEPAIKPGELALIVIRGVTWLLQKFPQLADRL